MKFSASLVANLSQLVTLQSDGTPKVVDKQQLEEFNKPMVVKHVDSKLTGNYIPTRSLVVPNQGAVPEAVEAEAQWANFDAMVNDGIGTGIDIDQLLEDIQMMES